MARRIAEALLSPAQRKLFEDPNFATIVTLDWEGWPHATTVWVDIDRGLIVVNTAVGRVKERNARLDDRVAIAIHDEKNPYTTVSVTGRIQAILEEGADRHIDTLAKTYL